MFLPSYIPFGGADGYLFFCDTRPGPHTGCIRQWHKEGADEGGPSWLTFTDMLRAVRTSITENSPLIEFPESARWWPHHYEGNLIWTPDELDLDEEAAAPLETSLPEPTPIDIPFPSSTFCPPKSAQVMTSLISRSLRRRCSRSRGCCIRTPTSRVGRPSSQDCPGGRALTPTFCQRQWRTTRVLRSAHRRWQRHHHLRAPTRGVRRFHSRQQGRTIDSARTH